MVWCYLCLSFVVHSLWKSVGLYSCSVLTACPSPPLSVSHPAHFKLLVLTHQPPRTHGHSRPFLPAMVRKNDSSAVGTQTAQAFSTLQNSQSQPPSQETILTALDQVCALKGVGPATGTLVLSVFEPTHVPFFQDEMFAWFFGPDHEKLKYSKPEYTRLLEAVTPVLQRIGCKAVELEKVAYVVGHVDLLFEEERQLLVKELGDIAEVKMEKDREGGTDEVVKKEPVEKKRAVGNKGKGRKRTVKDEDDGNGEDINQPPKRRSARNKG